MVQVIVYKQSSGVKIVDKILKYNFIIIIVFDPPPILSYSGVETTH